MLNWRSIRFRLSIQYSAVVFGLGGLILGGVYLALRSWLQSQTMMLYLHRDSLVVLNNGNLVRVPEMAELEMQAIQTVFAQATLDQAAKFTLLMLLMLFLLSLAVGWVMSGRVLKPVEEITDVASDIQASDLSRRIDLQGPDDELTRLADTFDRMLDRLDVAFKAQRQFLADTSHDLRTPLAVIQSNVELVADDPQSTLLEWQETGEIVRRNTGRMSDMIDDLLAAARLQTGRAQAVSLDLAHIVDAKASDFRTVAAERSVSVEALTAPAVVQGVEVSLDRALSNLIDNARRVAPEGSIIRLGSGVVGDWAWMGVEDQGPGLPEDGGEQIGLGLSIVTQIAEAHGGSLDSFPGGHGKGTSMVVWIPRSSHPGPVPGENPLSGSAVSP